MYRTTKDESVIWVDDTITTWQYRTSWMAYATKAFAEQQITNVLCNDWCNREISLITTVHTSWMNVTQLSTNRIVRLERMDWHMPWRQVPDDNKSEMESGYCMTVGEMLTTGDRDTDAEMSRQQPQHVIVDWPYHSGALRLAPSLYECSRVR